MIMRTLSVLFVAASLASLTACGGGHHPSPAQAGSTSSSDSSITGAIDDALDKASAKLATRNITISDDDDNEPKAEITPQGDLLIAGKPVSLTPAQHSEMLDYRHKLVQIAQQGIEVGKQGATLGVHAAGAAIAGVFSGESEEQIRQRVKAQASGIRKAAAKLCDSLPAMMASQQKLAADVPAFRPYADMTQDDIDDCYVNTRDKDD